MERAIGIDSIGVYVPRLYVDLTADWAKVRAPELSGGDVDKLVGKVTGGVGVTKMAIVDAHEDSATMAAMAAKRVIDAAGIDPRDIDYLAVGTETTVDQSKSMGAYVLGMLERHYRVSLAHVGAPQFQFACIGATYALETAVSRLRAGDHTRPFSLVVASDVSKYPLRTSGEYTQGAGAVALLVCDNPRLLALERGVASTITRDERDFFRPNGQPSAVVDGKYSIGVYLDCMEAAFEAYAARIEIGKGVDAAHLYEAIDTFCFHLPFPRMAEYAAARIFGWLWERTPEARARLAIDGLSAPGASRKDFERLLAQTPLFRSAFGRKVAPSLVFAREVGNIYSGALYLALASFFEESRDRNLAGRRVFLGSYGSGASAKALSGIVAEPYKKAVDLLRVRDVLRSEAEGGSRVALSMDEYERLHARSDVKLDASVRSPRGEFALERFGVSDSAGRTDRGYRYYGWIDE